jgi:integrase
LAILCASHSGEVLNAKWTEFKREQRVWVTPAAQMKAGKEHRVPLSDAATRSWRSRRRSGATIMSSPDAAAGSCR